MWLLWLSYRWAEQPRLVGGGRMGDYVRGSGSPLLGRFVPSRGLCQRRLPGDAIGGEPWSSRDYPRPEAAVSVNDTVPIVLPAMSACVWEGL